MPKYIFLIHVVHSQVPEEIRNASTFSFVVDCANHHTAREICNTKVAQISLESDVAFAAATLLAVRS